MKGNHLGDFPFWVFYEAADNDILIVKLFFTNSEKTVFIMKEKTIN